MKNRDYWNTKKKLDKISSKLKDGTAEAKGDGAKNRFDADKFLQRTSAVIALLISGIAGITVAITVIITSWVNDIKLSTVRLLPAAIVFLIMIPITCSITRYKNNQLGILFKKLDKMADGNYEADTSEAGFGIYKEAHDRLNAVCGAMSEKQEDLRTAVSLANNANETKSNFLSNVSHEIRTPVNAIIGMNEMIIRDAEDAVVKNYSIEAKNAADTLLNYFEDMLDSALLETGRLEIVPSSYNFGEMLAAAVKSIMPRLKAKKLEFLLEVNPEIPAELFGDEARIRQCLMNLLTNAVKYTETGSICLHADYSRAGNDEIEVLLSVRDTGIGIEKNDIQRITEPFERGEKVEEAKTSGIGLGIFVTSKLLTLMSSKLNIESSLGAGSDFSFRIVQKVLDWKMMGNLCEKVDIQSGCGEGYKESFHAPNARILVVDDSSVNLMIVQGLLKDTQICIDTAESGAQAVSLAKINKYDIAYIDHMMPEMDGIETMRRIRNDMNSLNRRIPIIVLTANVVPGGREEYIKEGFNDYISKPVDPLVLEKSVLDNLPAEKVNYLKEETEVSAEAKEQPVRDEFLDKLSRISGVVAAIGISYAGGLDLYKKIVEEFTVTGMSRADTIEQYYEQGDVKNYTIQVHALKSSARLLGAQHLSDLAAKLEAAGKACEVETIEQDNPELLRQYRELVTGLQSIFETSEDLPEIDIPSLKDALMAIAEMVEAFDFDSADSVMDQLKKVRIPEQFSKEYAKLKTLMAEVARDDIIELVNSVINSMK